MYKILLTFLFLLSGCLLYPGKACAAPRLQDTGEKTVIVIDPGHGGENRGTIEYDHDEKLMTMTTAMAMYEELLLYDDVEVYLTHTEDVDMSLKERAEFAESVEADFLFSIHYNASENHELFGSEIWVSSLAPFNGYGYQFGYLSHAGKRTACQGSQDKTWERWRGLLRHHQGSREPGNSCRHYRTLPCGP